MDLVEVVRDKLWQTVTLEPPYRRYYLYMTEGAQAPLKQWLAVYSTFFWLGSMTRYQPVEFFKILDGPLGPFVREFLSAQPSQLLYIMVSDMKRQDIAKANIV